MPTRIASPAARRSPLTRERVLRAALAIADTDGLEAVTMRRLGRDLGVEAMSIYHHLAGKEALLDGIVDAVVDEIELPVIGGDWPTEMRRRAVSARAALRRHPWATGLIDARTRPGAAILRHHDAVLGCLRTAGFPLTLAAHAFAVLDAFIYGFALQEASLAFKSGEEVAEVAAEVQAQFAPDDFPYLTEMIAGHALKPGYDFGAEFDYGLELILAGFTRALAAA